MISTAAASGSVTGWLRLQHGERAPRSTDRPESGATGGPPASASRRARRARPLVDQHGGGAQIWLRSRARPVQVGQTEPVTGCPHTYAIGVPTGFRGLTERQGMVWRGAAGWAEWSPFLRLRRARAGALVAGRRRGGRARLAGAGPHRDRRSTAPFPPSGPSRRARWPGRPAAGRPRSRSPSPADRWPTTWPGSRRYATPSARTAGSGSTPTGPGRSTRPEVAIRRAAPVRAGVRRAALPHGRGAGRAPPPAGPRPGSTCRSRPTSRSAGPTTPTGWPRAEAADIAVLKVQPLGGVRACLEIAERIGLPVVVSSALETSIGLAGRAGAGRGAARAALRLRAEHRRAAGRRRGRRRRWSPSTESSRWPTVVPDPAALDRTPRAAGRTSGSGRLGSWRPGRLADRAARRDRG